MPLQQCEVGSPAGQDSYPVGLAATGRQPVRKPGILVVDDEKMVRDLLQTVLRCQGFEVWMAGGGAEALAIYQQHRDEIALVLLDVRMPGLDGPQTLGALQRLDPAVRVCFMSGDFFSYDPNALLERGALRVFVKPFHLMKTVGILRELLDSGN